MVMLRRLALGRTIAFPSWPRHECHLLNGISSVGVVSPSAHRWVWASGRGQGGDERGFCVGVRAVNDDLSAFGNAEWQKRSSSFNRAS